MGVQSYRTLFPADISRLSFNYSQTSGPVISGDARDTPIHFVPTGCSFTGSGELFAFVISTWVYERKLMQQTRYIHDTPDIYEPDIVAQLVAEELTLQHKAETPIVHSGRTVVVIEHPLSRLARTLLAFPMGAVGQDLSGY